LGLGSRPCINCTELATLKVLAFSQIEFMCNLIFYRLRAGYAAPSIGPFCIEAKHEAHVSIVALPFFRVSAELHLPAAVGWRVMSMATSKTNALLRGPFPRHAVLRAPIPIHALLFGSLLKARTLSAPLPRTEFM
jgi:hypothetical protein